MKQYKLIIAYDGTDFSGWQIQPDKISVVQVLQDSFTAIFGRTVTIIGASRTDAGVHALAQVALLKTDFFLNTQRVLQVWNNKLPSSIVIRSITEVESDFYPFHNVENKTYYYHFFLRRPLPFAQRYGWYYWYPIDVDVLHNALQVFVGTHDFRSFATGQPNRDNPICTIFSISLEYKRRFGMYRIAVTGDRFLCHMVRRMVGAALAVATIKRNEDCVVIEKLLKEVNPNNSLPKAPAHGLLLYKIRYKIHKEH